MKTVELACDTEGIVASVRRALAEGWGEMPVASRCRLVAGARSNVAEAGELLADLVASEQRTERSQTFAGELIPLCDALRFLGKRGGRILKTRRLGSTDRPIWLWGVQAEVQRVPRGVVLVIGTWNYPLFLAGVQVAQALAAGNGVLWKPAPGCERASETLAECFWNAGVPKGCLQLIASDASSAVEAMRDGVDLVVLTGAAETGRKVLRQAAESLTPAIVELSGCDALVVLPGADLERVARAVKFGLAFNGGATCIGPRRLFVHRNQIDAFHEALVDCLKNHQTMVVHPAARQGIVSAIDAALKDGAGDLLGHYGESDFRADGKLRPVILDRATVEMDLMRADLFGPVAGLAIYEDVERVVQWINECPYGLAASVFGPEQESVQLANRLQVGTVVVNDLVAPTADPRLAFGGRRESGFGVTRGAEGLLEMTVPRVVTVRRRGPTPHLDPATRGEGDILAGALAIQHGKGIRRRFSGLHRLIKGVRLSRSNKE